MFIVKNGVFFTLIFRNIKNNSKRVKHICKIDTLFAYSKTKIIFIQVTEYCTISTIFLIWKLANFVMPIIPT